MYVVVLAYFLFFSEHYGRGGVKGYQYNLIPFQEIRRYLKYRHLLGPEYFIVNIFGNVLAFVPFGFFLPIISEENRSFFATALYSFELSLGVELVQLSFQVGIFDVDDIMMNTFGCVLGYILFFLFRKKLSRLL